MRRPHPLLGRPAALAIAVALAATARPAVAGGLRTADPASGFRVAAGVVPGPLSGGMHDFTLLAWVRRDAPRPGSASIYDGNGVVRLFFDDAAATLRARLVGAAGTLEVALPCPDPIDPSAAPFDRWCLVGLALDRDAGTLRAWIRAEGGPSAGGAATQPGWSPVGPNWPPRLGATTDMDGFAGVLGLVVVRDRALGDAEIDALWSDGAPRWFDPALRNEGLLDGWNGTAWMIGHGVLTDPKRDYNFQGTGAQLGDALTTNNLLMHNRTQGTAFESVGRLSSVTGAWTFVSPHDDDAPWSGFFVREAATLAQVPAGTPRAAAIPGDAARELAEGAATAPWRVVVSANSRAVRQSITPWYGTTQENWTFGGLLAVRRAIARGVHVPAIGYANAWPWFKGSARFEAPLETALSTATGFVAFGNFGSHGADNALHPGVPLAGQALAIHPGGAWIPKARPEPGTRFAAATDPIVVRALLLAFPGAGTARVEGERAAAQADAGVRDGVVERHPLDTTVLTRAFAAGDAIDATRRTLVLAGDLPGVTPGMACAVDAGPGAPATGGIALVASIAAGRSATTVVLERPLPVAPTPGAATLRFGPATPHWVERAWPGLEPGDPAIFRGVRVEAEGAPVVALGVEAAHATAPGFLVAAVGRGGFGYDMQLDARHGATAPPLYAALDADLWLQCVAHQGSAADSMRRHADAIRAASPRTELWWIGDPDFDTSTFDTETTDAWQAYIAAESADAGVGYVLPQEDPRLGTGAERAVDGQSSNRSHPSARGAERFMGVVLEMMHDAIAALEPADLDGDGVVGFADLLMLLAAWGPCPVAPPCAADLDGDGAVGFGDLVILLGAWSAP